MTKRCSKFKRMKGDFYATPEKAIVPLLPHLEPQTIFVELCAGDGALIDALTAHGHKCAFASDIDPKRPDIKQFDALNIYNTHLDGGIPITNPPWTRALMHPLIWHLSKNGPAWFLFDADWAHTIQAAPLLKHCHKIVSVGRVSWMGNGVFGLDNAAWYLFDQTSQGSQQFIGRAA